MLIPFLILCAAPRGKPLMSGEGYPMFFSGLLGITNGIVGSVPMIQAPRRVSEEHRELAGKLRYTRVQMFSILMHFLL